MAVASLLLEIKWPLVALLIALYAIRKVISYNRLRQFKGPPGTGFSDIPHSRAFLSGKCHEWYAEVSEKYGESLRCPHANPVCPLI